MRSLHEIARLWVGTPFVHQGRSAAGAAGVDCLGLLIGAAEAAAVLGRDGRPFRCHDGSDYARYPDTVRLKAGLDAALWELTPRQPPASDQIALFSVDGRAQHLGIIGRIVEEGDERLTLIHAYAPVGRVVEHRFDDAWRRRMVARYRAPVSA